MHHTIAASGRWMASFDRLLRHFRGSAPANDASCDAAGASSRPLPYPVRPVVARPMRATAPRAASSHGARRAVRAPLRVVRIMEAGQASALSGRIMMSGRMADVCAELDRMVEREAAMQARA